MATTANILTLLKYYASKQNSAAILYEDFEDYIHRYAQHHLDENSDLVIYCSTSYRETLKEELDSLIEQNQVALGNVRNKDYIFVTSFFVEKYSQIYANIDGNITIPFPSVSDLPKNVPHSILSKQPAADIIYNLLEKEDLSDRYLYAIVFDKGVNSVIYPSNVKMSLVVDLAIRKIQNILRKEDTHDYFQKKLCISNPGKEMGVKNFIALFTQKADAALNMLKESGDNFYYWTQLFYFIKQDYAKKKDFTPEEINILQAVSIAEVAASYFKSKAAERQQKEAALKNLEMLLHNPPYYFNMSDIVKFNDPNGIPLLGQYNEDELKKHLDFLTQEAVGNDLPNLLIFKINDNEGYFIYKDKVMPLLIRLSNDARVLIRESLIKQWYKVLLDFETLPEMKEGPAFERCLERELKAVEPVFLALLNASFLPVIAFEDQTPGKLMLYRNNILVPYSELLMLSRAEILSDAKIKLPFWYSLPLIPWIMGLLLKKPKPKKPKAPQSASLITVQEEKRRHEEKLKKLDEADRLDPKLNRKRELRQEAVEAEKQIVPENSSIDRELEGYLHEWNDRIGKKNFDTLTEDINSLIRDYLRKVMRSLKNDRFTMERINSLADSLVDSPGMMTIKNHPALKRYVCLYLIKLVKNLP